MNVDSGNLVPFEFRARSHPLQPRALYARAGVAQRLAERLLATESSAVIAGLRALGGARSLWLVGETEALPWVDGVMYFGYDRNALQLLIPTTLEPTVPIDLLERQVLRTFASAETAPPYALVPEQRAVVALGTAHLLTRAFLTDLVNTACSSERRP